MEKKKKLLLALGTNIHQQQNMAAAKHQLEELFSGIRFTDTVETEPVGIVSGTFLNCMAVAEVPPMEEGDLLLLLKSIELLCGDLPSKRARNEIEMDIDILLYGDRKFHAKDWERPYIQELMNQLFNSRQ